MGAVSAPAIVTQAPIAQIGEAIGEFPAQQRQAQMQQAELDAKNMEIASQKFSVLNKMLGSNPALSNDPHMIAATQRAFQQMGLTAPMTNVNGVQGLDMTALAAFGPTQDFLAQNMGTVLSFAPEQRAAYIKATTGQDAPQGVLDSLNKLPVRTITSPSEATGMLTTLRGAFTNISKGGDVNNAITQLDMMSKPLAQLFGITPEEFTNQYVAELKPDVTATLQRQAMLNLTNAKTDEQKALAQTQIQELPAKIAQIKSLTDLHAVMAEYYPEIADARATSANAAASNAATRVSEAPSTIARNNAQAGYDTARTADLNYGNAGLAKLQKGANDAQTLYSHIQYDLAQRKTDLSTLMQTAGPDDPQVKKLQGQISELQSRADAAETSAKKAQHTYESAAATHVQAAKTGDNDHPVAQDFNGREVYFRNGKYVYDDNTPYVPPK